MTSYPLGVICVAAIQVGTYWCCTLVPHVDILRWYLTLVSYVGTSRWCLTLISCVNAINQCHQIASCNHERLSTFVRRDHEKCR